MNKRKMLLNLTTLWLVVAAVLSSGCSKVGESGDLQPGPGTDRSIRLSAGLQAVTKAAVGGGASFTASVGGWESAGAADYGKAASWLSTASVTASESASDIALTPQQYYSQNGAERTYIKAWYPQGTFSGGVVSFAGDAHYKGDGRSVPLYGPGRRPVREHDRRQVDHPQRYGRTRGARPAIGRFGLRRLGRGEGPGHRRYADHHGAGGSGR